MKEEKPDSAIIVQQEDAPIPTPAAARPINWDADRGENQMDNHNLTHSGRIVVITGLLLLIAGLWAGFGTLDEVSTGTGKVIPSSREQVLQSLDGGILVALNVHEGQRVDANQIVARLDPTRSQSNVGESVARYQAALAASARLSAEVNDSPLKFPAALDAAPDLIASETRLYNLRRSQFADSKASINDSLNAVNRELGITRRLASTGAASSVEVLRLDRQKSDLQLKLLDLRSQYLVQAREELAKATAEAASLAEVIKGREDSVNRSTVRSPVKGIVKNIKVNTLGGVIPPNGELMEIVPVDDHLLIEARLSPRDIAFIHPDQKALVKITAYDYAIYGGLDGVVDSISPDTIQDEAKPEIYYYRVFIRTSHGYLQNKAGKRFNIVPGMIANVDIKTGEKTVLDYLVKPFNKAKEALRER